MRMATRDKSENMKKRLRLQHDNRIVSNPTNYRHKVSKEKKIALFSVENLGPRRPEGKLLKLKRN